MRIEKGDTIAVWFSRGAASAVAAKMTLLCFPDQRVRVVTNPVKEEHPDNIRFEKDVSDWLGVEIEHSINPEFPCASCITVWEKARAMSFIHGAPCTTELKKRARQEWENRFKPDWHVLGFTADEVKRHFRFVQTERENVIPVLCGLGITKQDCVNILQKDGIVLPEMYGMGYPNANCIGCVKATSPTYWNAIRRDFPEVFRQRSEMSRRIGARLARVRGKRIFLDELDPKAKGAPMKSMQLECGTFCEEQ